MRYQICYKNYSFVGLRPPRYGLLLLLFLISSINLNAITDTTKTKQQYDINDPRNPNCPCHKYQKQADEEFARKNHQSVKNKKSYTSFRDIKKELSPPHKAPEHSVDTISLNNSHNINVQNEINLSDVTNENRNVSITKSDKYERSEIDLSKSPHSKKRLFYARIRFRFYMLNKNIRKIKVQPNYKVCFKWN